MSQPPTREQLIAALIVLGHSEESAEQLYRVASAVARNRQKALAEGHRVDEYDLKRSVDIAHDLPALWRHVSQPSGLSAGKGEK